MSTRPRCAWWRTTAVLSVLTLCLNLAPPAARAATIDVSDGGACPTADCKDHGKETFSADVGSALTLHVFDDGSWELRNSDGSLAALDGLKVEYMPIWGALVMHLVRAYLGMLVGSEGGFFISVAGGVAMDYAGDVIMPIPEAKSTTYTVWRYQDCRKKENVPGYEAVYQRLEFTVTQDKTTTVKAWVEDGGPYLGPYKLAPKTESCYLRYFEENH